MAQILFYAGAVLMSAAAVGAVIALALLRRSGKRLQAQLEAEYGKKRC